MSLLWIGVIGLAAYHTWSMRIHYSTIEELPAGRIATTPLAAEKLAWLAARTKPGQFMLQAGWPGMYLPLALRNPIFLDDLEGGGASRLGYVALSIRQLEAKRVQYILWSPRLESPAYSLAVFHAFLVDYYQPIWRFSDQDEIWERKPETARPDKAYRGAALSDVVPPEIKDRVQQDAPIRKSVACFGAVGPSTGRFIRMMRTAGKSLHPRLVPGLSGAGSK
jgi:hypothetical protein